MTVADALTQTRYVRVLLSPDSQYHTVERKGEGDFRTLCNLSIDPTTKAFTGEATRLDCLICTSQYATRAIKGEL